MPSERDELLDRVYARANGLWWRRRFAPVTAGVVVLSLAIGVPVLRAGDGDRPTKLATAPARRDLDRTRGRHAGRRG